MALSLVMKLYSEWLYHSIFGYDGDESTFAIKPVLNVGYEIIDWKETGYGPFCPVLIVLLATASYHQYAVGIEPRTVQ
jgi:hypothetical protein